LPKSFGLIMVSHFFSRAILWILRFFFSIFQF
jgi:hypothetical protein